MSDPAPEQANSFRRRRWPQIASCAFALAIGTIRSCDATEWPRQMRWVVGSPSGSAIDNIARKLAGAFSDKFGVTVVVEDKPGASSSVAGADVARAKPDGATLLVSTSDAIVGVLATIKSPPYDPRRDLAYIAKVAASGAIMVASPDYGASSLNEFIDKAKRDGAEVKYGSFGAGTFPHLALESLNRQAGLSMRHVPYRGSTAGMQGLLAHEVTVTMSPATVAAELRKSGLLKALAVMSDERSPLVPDVPTFGEAGFDSFIFKDAPWLGFIGPAALPRAFSADLSAALNDLARGTETAAFLKSVGFQFIGAGPEEFERQAREEIAVVTPLMASLGITPE